MSASAIVMMVLICGVVWGGFAFFLVRAMRSEDKKRSSAHTAD